MYANVYIDNRSAAVDRIYDYAVPAAFEGIVKPAMRVVVPFGKGNRLCQAFVVHLSETTQYDPSKLKEIRELIDPEPAIPAYLVKIASFLHDEYFCTYAEAIRTVLPSTDKTVRKITYLIKDNEKDDSALTEEQREIYQIVLRRGHADLSYIRTKLNGTKESVLKTIAFLISNDFLESEEEFLTAGKEPVEEWVDLADRDVPLQGYLSIVGSRAKKQAELIRFLWENGRPIEKSELLQKAEISPAVLKKLTESALVVSEFRRKALCPEELPSPASDSRIPNDDQTTVLNQFHEALANGRKKYLLFGVTGSGKTLVYFRMFGEMLKQGKQCLLLVPEISLTPQMMRLVRSAFREHVAVMHSKLTAAERHIEFLKVKRGEARIVLGARSALFMPFRDLGIIVVDEEHETSYKSSQSPRYDTIAVANRIAEITGCALVLSSATPSIESYYRAKKSDYTLLHLPKRINGAPMPEVSIIDMRNELYSGNRTPISRKLKDAVSERLRRGEQTVLFLNRRGFNTYIFCRDCGYIEMCPNCEVSLTYHMEKKTLSCHYCGYSKPVPKTCPECGGDRIKYAGTGTEKIERQAAEIFPDARILRLDSDTARYKGAYERILNRFASGDADILIGTQMVVKGLDFENVTLVGILLADTSLNFPDINAAARTFQLTEQAAGRAGRREVTGEVILQTYQPGNPTLVYASMHDYEGFYGYDIAHRQKMWYPPFTEILGIFAANGEEEQCVADIRAIYAAISQCADSYGESVTLYEPSPAFLQKLKNKYIYHMLIRYRTGSAFKSVFRDRFNELKLSVSSNVYVEINPITLL